ncbi:MAG: copper resistance protein CopC [Labedaea sp.]
MFIRRSVATLALSGIALLALAAPAFAHAELTGSNPAKDASVATAPKQVQLTFSEPVSPKTVTVTGPQSTQWKVGEIAVAGNVVTVPVTAVGPAGQYAITYTVLSDDGDDVTGTVSFTLTAPATPSSTATSSGTPAGQAQPASDSGGPPAWVWIAIALAAVLAVGALVLFRLRRGSASSAER